ncbi:conserved hypothetical protein [Nostocoides jenkinsii Ben 74]|uniref:DUF937 domain-containing protein n=2 Tax=Nostocoides jenkinsii TaxID=330834 RepID=A0A077M6G2_9MICO|nr:conserved hypothetical protein [Tetrasphaera jenkinsii Ben 74]
MSNAVDDILNSLDMAQLADMVGASQSEVEQATAAALPALFGGLDANAQDPAGAGSILEALGQHDGELLDGGVDLGQVDAQDGEAITRHIFGSNEDAVYNQLGGYGAAGGLGGSLFRKLLPILAPIVLSYIMKQMTQRTGGSSSGSGGGGLGDILGQVLGGKSAAQPQDAQVDDNVLPQRTEPTSSAPSTSGQPDLNDILKDVLGGAASSQTSRQQAPSGGGSVIDILGSILGGGRR